MRRAAAVSLRDKPATVPAEGPCPRGSFAMSVIEAIGYLGVGLVFVTFYMRTMVPLRVVAIASNLVLILYGFAAPVYPILVLHLVLLPLNLLRLHQMNQLIRQVRAAAAGSLSLDWLKPFTVQRRAQAGEVLFRKGDVADEMFFVVSGRLRLLESGVELGAGAVVGELGLLAPGRLRTQALQCVEDAALLRIGYDRVEQLYFQNPRFGFYFLRLTTARLFQNLAALEQRLEARS
jgi:hypothetical protein